MSRCPSAIHACCWIFAALSIAGCAPADVRLTDTEVVHIPRAALLENPERLPDAGFLSTGQPNEEMLDLVAAAGYAAIVDLRGVEEDRGIDERAEVEARGMQYVSLPTPDLSAATTEQAGRLAEILAEIDGPVLLHCFSGNRVGSLFALEARAEGKSAEEALAFGEAAGLTRWRTEIREKVEAN